MEGIFKEYAVFVNDIIANHPFSDAGTIGGMKKRLQELQLFTKEFEEKTTEEANRLLVNIEDKDRIEFENTINEMRINAMRAHVPANLWNAIIERNIIWKKQ